MRLSHTSRYYELLPGLPIEVTADVPVGFRCRIECELGLYRRPVGGLEGEPVLVVDGGSERTLEGGLRLGRINLPYNSPHSSVALQLRKGSLLICGLWTGEKTQFLCRGEVSTREAWYYLENTYKHICLLMQQTVFIHGCGFRLRGQDFFLSGWRGSGKTFLLLAALKRGGVFFGEDFLMLSETGAVYPYVPLCFDFAYYHVLHLDLLNRLRTASQLRCLVAAAGAQIVRLLSPHVLGKFGDRVLRRVGYQFLNWQGILSAAGYGKDSIPAVGAQWYVLKRTDDGGGCSIGLPSGGAASSLLASALHEMRKYLDLLWQVEFLGLDLEEWGPAELTKRAARVIDRGVRDVTVRDIRLPGVLDWDGMLDRLLQSEVALRSPSAWR